MSKTMKKLIIAVLACLPVMGMAQSNVWEIPDDQPQTVQKQAKKQKVVKEKKKEDPKYLAGAVPEVDGHVVFTLDKDVPGMSADSIYNKVYRVMQAVVNESKDKDLVPESRIAAVNKTEHSIAARIKEWLVFSSNFISLDRTELSYTLVARASDGHINMTMERINYAYETKRGNNQGLRVKAEEWISDGEALTKNGDKLRKMSGKFRRKTIDRKDNIFGRVCKALGI